jgi:peptidylprolyl isomerase
MEEQLQSSSPSAENGKSATITNQQPGSTPQGKKSYIKYVAVGIVIVLMVAGGVLTYTRMYGASSSTGSGSQTNLAVPTLNSNPFQPANAPVPVVGVGDTVKINYTGTFTNGTVFDSNIGKQPLVFTVGSGQVIPGLDNGVIGMKLGEEKILTIPANEAYGPINSTLITQIPRSALGNQTVQVGMGIGGTSGGKQEQGTVTAVNATYLTVDFNPPLAGDTLIFNVTVVGIQKAT